MRWNFYELLSVILLCLASALAGYYIGENSTNCSIVAKNYWFEQGYIAGNNRVIIGLKLGSKPELLKYERAE